MVGDRPKSILEDAPEGNPALADGVVVAVRLELVLATEFNQLPHQPIGFGYGQLVPGRGFGMDTIIAVVMDFRRNVDFGGVVVGDGDADESLVHVPYFLSVPSWNILSITEVIRNCKPNV